ncbi:MAG: hypothetical protein V1738_03325 [Patescibacteria group bacterium]
MCDFVSWIEKDGKIFYLTDREVFGPRGKELFGGDPTGQGNDPLGHGAIRAFYEFEGGENREERDFWKEGVLPDELADIMVNEVNQYISGVDKFKRYWGRMLEGKVFQCDDLMYIYSNAPEGWRSMALEQLLLQDPPAKYLVNIFSFGFREEWREQAWKMLAKKTVTNLELIQMFHFATDKWSDQVWKRLVKQDRHCLQNFGISEDLPTWHLVYIVSVKKKPEWCDAAWKILESRPLTNSELCRMFRFAPDEWSEKAWQRLVKQNPTGSEFVDLKDFMFHVEQMKRVCQILFERNPSNDLLLSIINYGGREQSDEACKILFERNPSKDDLIGYIQHISEMWCRGCPLLRDRPMRCPNGCKKNCLDRFISRVWQAKFNERIQSL